MAPFWAAAELITATAPALAFKVSLEDMVSGTGRLADGELSEYQADGVRFRPGDVLFGKLRPYLAKYWLADRDGTAGGDIHVYRPVDGIDPRFLRYVVGTSDFVRFAEAASRGTKMPRTVWMALRTFPVTSFGRGQQRRIADHLDRETAEIDAMDAELDRLVETLRERRMTAIRAPIKGFPEVALGYHCRVVNGSTPLRSRADFWTETGGTPWLNSAAVNNAVVVDAPREVTAKALKECHLPTVLLGDLLIGLTGQGRTRGMVAMAGIDCTISQHLAAIQPWSEWDPKFLFYALGADYLKLRHESEDGGSTKGAITCEMLAQYKVALPPLETQRRIAAELDEQTARIDDMIADAQRLKELLAERRSTLITDVVTGRKEVPA